MEILFIKPDSDPDGGAEIETQDPRWFPGMAVQTYEDGGIGTPVTSKRCFAIRIPGVTKEQAKIFFVANLLDPEKEALGDEAVDEFGSTVRPRLKRRLVRLNFNLIPPGPRAAYQAGQRDFTFTKDQVLGYLEEKLPAASLLFNPSSEPILSFAKRALFTNVTDLPKIIRGRRGDDY